ncbi:copper resistance protein CopC [Mycolicibacterium sp.]|uniref:copper resistance protein CopC n=1 Tax=Mycolicibacterium sp. TaxID=2320850 RepID=UPI003D0B379D
MTILIAGKQRPARRGRASLLGLLAVVLGGMLALLGAQPASAHAQLLSTTPEDGAVLEQAPAEAVLRFNETVLLLDGSIRLFPGDESPIVLDAHVKDTDVIAPLPADLVDGRYALSYRVVSADGHPVSGAISFTIGEATGAQPAPQIQTDTPLDTQFALSALTVLQYLGLLAFTGLVFFERVVLRSHQPATSRTRAVLLAAGSIAAAASMLLIPVSALNVTGSPFPAFLSPPTWWPGILWPPVVAALIVLVGTVIGSLAGTRTTTRTARIVSLLAVLAALCSPVLVGHSQLVEPRTLVIIADLGHLASGAFWVGGVIGLLLFLADASPARRDPAAGTDPLLAAEVVRRFSSYALWSVILLAVSGTVMGIMIVGTLDALVTTGYGLTLLLKLGIVAPVIAIAAYNRRRLLPAILTRPTTRLRWRTLHRTLAYEAALLVAVLAVTGFLTNQSPNHDHHDTGTTTAQTLEVDGSAQQLTVDGTLTPALTGDNELVFTLHYQGEAVTPESVTVRASLPEHDLGPFQVVPELDPTTGEYTAALGLPVAGEWQIQVLARVSTFAEPIVTIPVTVR